MFTACYVYHARLIRCEWTNWRHISFVVSALERSDRQYSRQTDLLINLSVMGDEDRSAVTNLDELIPPNKTGLNLFFCILNCLIYIFQSKLALLKTNLRWLHKHFWSWNPSDLMISSFQLKSFKCFKLNSVLKMLIGH